MKNILYCDKYLYQKIYMGFPKKDLNNNIIGSLFSMEDYNNFHIIDKHYLNLCLNVLAGIKNIHLIVIQKSWFSDPICIQICRYVKMMHPESKLVFFMDEGIEKHKIFLNKIVEDNLAFIAKDIDEFNHLVNLDFSLEQKEYILPSLKKKELKRLIHEYNNS